MVICYTTARQCQPNTLNGGDHMSKKRYYLAYGSNLNR